MGAFSLWSLVYFPNILSKSVTHHYGRSVLKPKIFWPAPPTFYPSHKYHMPLESPWKRDFKKTKKILACPTHSLVETKIVPVHKNKQKLLFIKYVSVLYIPLEILCKTNFEKSDKIWPTPPSCSPKKLVPDFEMAKNGC